MGFSSIDAFVKALTNGRKQEWRFSKDGGATNETPEAAGNWVSYYLATGSPGAAAAPATGAWASFDGGDGSVEWTNVASAKRYLYAIEAAATESGTLMVYDRLGHRRFDTNALTVVSSKTTTATLATRMSTAEPEDKHNVEAWIEITEATAAGTTCAVSLNSYTNSDGTAARAGGTLTFPAQAINIGWFAPFPLQAGDKGVSAINTWNVSVAGTTSGEANVVMLRPIAFVPVVANIVTLISVKDGLIPRRIYDDSSLCFAFFANNTNVVDFWGSITTAYDGS